MRHRTNCSWVCVNMLAHCVPPSTMHSTYHPASIRAMLKGHEWEGDCKAHVRDSFRLNGTLAVVAGLFYGDWLPVLSEAVGEGGRVAGFEPTENLHRARATADANGLHNVDANFMCLSNVSMSASMCVRRASPGATDGAKDSVLAGQSTLLGSASAARHTGVAAADCLATQQVECASLDATLPWHRRNVSLLLLDVEGHEEEALSGAIRLISKWKPVLALEAMMKSFPTLKAQLGERGLRYVPAGRCSGLHFYTAAA